MRYLILLILAGCGGMVTVPSDQTTAYVVVEWVDPAEPACRAAGAESKAEIYACAQAGPLCRIWAPKPRSFDDYDRLIALGHEFLHCLGWKHP